MSKRILTDDEIIAGDYTTDDFLTAVHEIDRLRSALDAQDARVTDLILPFILTDKVPTEPGWYVVVWRESDAPVIIDTKDCSLNFLAKGYRWGSAPLPIQEQSDDE